MDRRVGGVGVNLKVFRAYPLPGISEPGLSGHCLKADNIRKFRIQAPTASDGRSGVTHAHIDH